MDKNVTEEVTFVDCNVQTSNRGDSVKSRNGDYISFEMTTSHQMTDQNFTAEIKINSKKEKVNTNGTVEQELEYSIPTTKELDNRYDTIDIN